MTLLQRLPALWFPAAMVLLYCSNFPYFAGIQSANELPRIYLSMAIVDRGALNIDPELKRFAPTPDTSTKDGKLYCNKAPGMSFVTVPVYAALKAFNGWKPLEGPANLRTMFFWFRLLGATLPSLLFLWLLWRALGQLIPGQATRRVVLAAYALGTMASTYGTLLIAHQLSGLLVASGYLLLMMRARKAAGRWAPLLAGLCAGAGVLVDYQVAFIGPPLFLYGLLVMRRARLRSMALFCAGAALPLAGLLLYQWGAFGSPLRTGYHYVTNVQFQQWHQQGFLGMKGFSIKAFWAAFFSSDNGLFYFSPFLVLALPGLVLMLRRPALRADGLLCLVLVLFFAYFTSSLAFWPSGWDVGPRYITCALPYFLVPAAVLCARAAAARGWAWSALTRGLAAASILFYVTINAVFPHFPGNFSDPWFDVIVRFGRAGYLPYNLGWSLGLTGVASALPQLAVALALWIALLLGGQRPRRARLLRGGLALALVALLVGFYYGQLSYRRMPVPNDQFIGWMEGMWEPRHPRMDPRRLLPAKDPGASKLSTRKPWWPGGSQ